MLAFVDGHEETRATIRMDVDKQEGVGDDAAITRDNQYGKTQSPSASKPLHPYSY